MVVVIGGSTLGLTHGSSLANSAYNTSSTTKMVSVGLLEVMDGQGSARVLALFAHNYKKALTASAVRWARGGCLTKPYSVQMFLANHGNLAASSLYLGDEECDKTYKYSFYLLLKLSYDQASAKRPPAEIVRQVEGQDHRGEIFVETPGKSVCGQLIEHYEHNTLSSDELRALLGGNFGPPSPDFAGIQVRPGELVKGTPLANKVNLPAASCPMQFTNQTELTAFLLGLTETALQDTAQDEAVHYIATIRQSPSLSDQQKLQFLIQLVQEQRRKKAQQKFNQRRRAQARQPEAAPAHHSKWFLKPIVMAPKDQLTQPVTPKLTLPPGAQKGFVPRSISATTAAPPPSEASVLLAKLNASYPQPQAGFKIANLMKTAKKAAPDVKTAAVRAVKQHGQQLQLLQNQIQEVQAHLVKSQQNQQSGPKSPLLFYEPNHEWHKSLGPMRHHLMGQKPSAPLVDDEYEILVDLPQPISTITPHDIKFTVGRVLDLCGPKRSTTESVEGSQVQLQGRYFQPASACRVLYFLAGAKLAPHLGSIAVNVDEQTCPRLCNFMSYQHNRGAPVLGSAQELNLVDSKVRQAVRQFQEQVAKHTDLRKQAEEDLLQRRGLTEQAKLVSKHDHLMSEMMRVYQEQEQEQHAEVLQAVQKDARKVAAEEEALRHKTQQDREQGIDASAGADFSVLSTDRFEQYRAKQKKRDAAERHRENQEAARLEALKEERDRQMREQELLQQLQEEKVKELRNQERNKWREVKQNRAHLGMDYQPVASNLYREVEQRIYRDMKRQVESLEERQQRLAVAESAMNSRKDDLKHQMASLPPGSSQRDMVKDDLDRLQSEWKRVQQEEDAFARGPVMSKPADSLWPVASYQSDDSDGGAGDGEQSDSGAESDTSEARRRHNLAHREALLARREYGAGDALAASLYTGDVADDLSDYGGVDGNAVENIPADEFASRNTQKVLPPSVPKGHICSGPTANSMRASPGVDATDNGDTADVSGALLYLGADSELEEDSVEEAVPSHKYQRTH
eukprot:gene7202-1286_t